MFTFTQLEEACHDVGYIVSTSQYDCGERVTVRWPNGSELFSAARDCGDKETAVDITVAYMLANGHLRDSDIPQLKPDTD